MILHTVSKSPFEHNAYRNCKRIAASDDVILLIEDGVYALLSTTPGATVYALQGDVDARGISAWVPGNVKLVDYADFVELVTKASAVQSWY